VVDDVKIEFSLNAKIFVEPVSGAPGFDTRIIGLKKNRYLLLALPVLPPEVGEGSKVWAYCSELPIGRFETRILRILSDPPLLVMNYPAPLNFEVGERRSGKRHKVFIRVNLQQGKSIESQQGYILNISTTGCLVAGDFSSWLDEVVSFSFRIPGTQEVILGLAKVVRGESGEQGLHWGLEFVDLSQSQLNQLKQFLNSIKDIQKPQGALHTSTEFPNLSRSQRAD